MCYKLGVLLLLLLNSSKIIIIRAIEVVITLCFMSRVKSILNCFVTYRVSRKKINIIIILFFIDIRNL